MMVQPPAVDNGRPGDIPFEPVDVALSADQASRFTGGRYPESSPVVIRVSGACPRCEHVLPVWDHFLFGGVAAAVELDESALDQLAELEAEQGRARPSGSARIDMACRCQASHKDRPEGVQGCGARYAITVSWP